MTDDHVELKRGLRDVYIDKTESTFIDGKNGKLFYRGYSIHDLADSSSFEETIYLLLHGSLPTRTELRDFDGLLKGSRELPDQVIEIIRLIRDAHPMDVLRTAVSALAAYGSDVADTSIEATLQKGIKLTAQAPTIVAAHARIREGKDPVPPNAELSHAGNFLYMLLGNEPDPENAALMDKDFILHADHGANASAFGARVVASTQADLHGAITASIGILKGPSHGGAAEAVMRMALEIGSEENAEAYVRDLLRRGERVMGFGHPVYKVVDPRSVHLRNGAKALSDRMGQPKWFSILEAVDDAMEPYAARGICQNVDFFSGAIYYLMGIPDDLFISVFAMGRIPGWTLQVVEQLSNNMVIRPRLLYVGPLEREYVPIDRREQRERARLA